MTSTMPDDWYNKQARDQYHIDGEVEIDDDAKVSRNSDPSGSDGAYVQAWVWVANPDDTDDTTDVTSQALNTSAEVTTLTN